MSARTNRHSAHREPRYAAGELAWIALELCRFGTALRARGWCTGDVLPCDLRAAADGVTHIPVPRTVRGFFLHADRRRRRYRHQHRGHVDGCFEIGIPAPAFAALMRVWGDEGSALLLEDAMTSAVAEIRRDGERAGIWTRASAVESLSFTIGQRVTVRRPALSAPMARRAERRERGDRAVS